MTPHQRTSGAMAAPRVADLQPHVAEAVRSVTWLAQGANSLVYKVATSGRSYVVKQYCPIQSDGYDRAVTEFGALSFLWARGFRDIPRPVAYVPDGNLSIHVFEEGTVPDPTRIGDADVQSLAAFIARVYRLGDADKHQFPPERTACLSLGGYARAIASRIARLRADAPSAGTQAAGWRLLEEHVCPRWHALEEEFHAAAATAGLSVDEDLPLGGQVVTPGDYGLHNMLVCGSRRVFLDFEYFGRDDPARHIVHFLHHDWNARLPRRVKNLFVNQLASRTGLGASVSRRMRLVDPLVGMEWVLIYLGVLSAERQAQIAWAGRDVQRLIDVRLAKAARKLDALRYFA